MPSEKIDELAVMLNQNARRVTKRMRRSLEDLLPRAQLYTSHTLDEARMQVREALDRGHDRIVCGGGDGTIVILLNQIREYVEEKNAQLAEYVDEKNARFTEFGSDVRKRFDHFSFPKIGILKLGTGNAFADVVGSRKPKSALLRLDRDRNIPTTRFHLIESEDRVFHFSGLGYDAAIINDYVEFRKRFDRGPLAPWFRTIGGYLSSMAFKTIPELIRAKRRPNVRVTNGDGAVFRVGHGSEPELLTDRPGDVIYEGPVNLIGGGTTPYYGFHLHAFPFARTREGFFNFRVISARIPELLRHCVSIFRGRYEADSFNDFLAQDVTLEFDQPMPYQVGGDAAGFRETLRLRLAKFCVEVFDFQAA